jgi:molybdenum cofactor cytidylyltransferase
MRTFGLIPAAGKSVRMGMPKLMLPLGGTTILERVVRAIRTGGVEDVVVVIGPGNNELRAAGEAAGAHVLALEADTGSMRETCLQGLAWLESRFGPREDDGWLLLPADHPTVGPDIVRALLAAAAEHPERSIIVPVHQERRGHPVWLRWHSLSAIRAIPPDQGLNAFIRSHADQMLQLPWTDPAILLDLDTPEDYHRLMEDELAPR